MLSENLPMETAAQLIVLLFAVLSVVGNALPAGSKAGRVIRAITADARALLDALKRDTPSAR